MVSVRTADAFLLPTPNGYAFGAVLQVDHRRELAIVRTQAGEYAEASLVAVRSWKETLARIATEVQTA